jgi:hypothetical protein
MSNGFLPTNAGIGTIPPELFAQQQALNRQQQMAQLLMQQGMQQPQGQMISGHYVKPSIFQQLTPLAQLYAGTSLQEKGDKAMVDLAEQLRKGRSEAEERIIKNLTPQTQTTEMAGPYTGNVPMPTMQTTLPPNYEAALREIRTNPYGAGKEYLPSILKNVIPEPIKPTTDMQNYEYAKSTGFKGTFNDFRNQMTPYQQAQLSIDRERLDLDKIKNLAKPLPEGLNKQVTGAVNLTDAIADYQQKIKGFGVKEFANPNKRAEMGNAYNNMMLQAKEAYNLGVLNGPDYAILQKVVRDPTNVSSLAFANDSLSRQADSLRDTARSIVRNAYMSQGREVPADIMSKFTKIEAPKEEKPTVKQQLGFPNRADIDAEIARRQGTK